MTATRSKLQTLLFSILLLVSTLQFHQCDASTTALKSVDGKYHADASTITSPIGHSGIRGNTRTTEDVTTHRHLDEKIHKRSDTPLFPVLLATVLVNVLTLVALLTFIPVLMSVKFSIFKSAFWVANEQLAPPSDEAAQYWNMNKSSIFQAKSMRELGSSTRPSSGVKSPQDPEKSNNQTEDMATFLSSIFFPAFSCGVIVATILFLVIPEAILLIQRGTSDESGGQIEILPGSISRYGVSVMAGFMLPLTLSALFPKCPMQLNMNKDDSSNSSESENNDIELTKVDYDQEEEKIEVDEGDLIDMGPNDAFDEEGTGAAGITKPGIRTGAAGITKPSIRGITKPSIRGNMEDDSDYEENPRAVSFPGEDDNQDEDHFIINGKLATSILVSDSVHNFFDGTFIGVAFLTCSWPTAICVSIIALYGEITQEMASYFLLTNAAGISIPRALLLIFVSGLSCVVGALVIVSVGLGQTGVGLFLAFASGSFLHIAAGECLPRVYALVDVTRDRLFALGFFIIGALPVGLTLLVEGHCTA